MTSGYDDVFRHGSDKHREFVNPLIAQRAKIAAAEQLAWIGLE